MKKINFANNSEPYLSAENLNQMQDNIEEAIGENYSTEETFTGKYWIDGKKIYRKVINCGSMPNSTSKFVQTGLDINKIDIIGIRGTAKATSGSTIPLPFVTSVSTAQINIYMLTDGTLGIESGADRSSYSGYVILEYTKTTD